MERNIKIRGIVLKKLQIGESNVGVSLLTENDEVLFVMAFGASKVKSKLFGAVNPLVDGLWDLYYDPVKDHWRVKEVSVNNYNNDIHGSLEGFYTASFFSEVILKSEGAEGVYSLFSESLKYLHDSNLVQMVLLQFLLRFLVNQGFISSFSSCSNCNREVHREPLFYIGYDGLICSRCFNNGKSIELNPGICVYCEKTCSLPFDTSLKIGLNRSSILQLKDYLITLIKRHTEGKLLTLDSCDGLI